MIRKLILLYAMVPLKDNIALAYVLLSMYCSISVTIKQPVVACTESNSFCAVCFNSYSHQGYNVEALKFMYVGYWKLFDQLQFYMLNRKGARIMLSLSCMYSYHTYIGIFLLIKFTQCTHIVQWSPSKTEEATLVLQKELSLIQWI